MKLCGYGCGREAKYPPKKGKRKWSCEEHTSKCPAIIEKAREKNIGKKRTNAQVNNLKNGRTGKKNSPPEKLVDNDCILCSYGCENLASYYFKISKKYCCSDHFMKCPVNKKKISDRLKGHDVSKETKKKISKKIKNLNISETEYRIKQSVSRKYKLKDYKEKYPFFYQVEEMREHSETNEIQVHCHNHNCPNSKEEGGWFTPTYTQLYERIRQLETKDGQDGCYFYCSKECKELCPSFNLKSDPLKNTEKSYTNKEYQTFRKFVLERDDYICQFCGKPADYVHHERPQKLEPFFTLDPDLAWSCCEKCHYKYGHKPGTECSTGNLANKIC